MWWFALFFLFQTTFGNNDWDLLVFTQHWPTTCCVQYKESGRDHFCLLPKKPNSWTVHGVWPTKLQTKGPEFCNPSEKFNISVIKPIEEEMLEIWPNLQGGKREWSLWEHEWAKHGTCATNLPTLNSEEKYFEKGLEWFKGYNMTSILTKSDIVPSNSIEYQVEAIHQAVLNTVGAKPYINCILEEKTHKPYLFEIRICFNKNLSLVSCEGVLLKSDSFDSFLTNCPKDQLIRYPSQVPNAVSKLFTGYMLKIVEFLIFLHWVI